MGRKPTRAGRDDLIEQPGDVPADKANGKSFQVHESEKIQGDRIGSDPHEDDRPAMKAPYINNIMSGAERDHAVAAGN